jgi:ankyrin repeat protein
MKTIVKISMPAAALALALSLMNAGWSWFHHRSDYGPVHQYAKSCDRTNLATELGIHPGALNLPDDARMTPLHVAAAQCCTNVVALLLEKGAALELKAKGGPTPLHLAAQEGCADAVSMLLARGAQVNARDDQGRTPLKRATQWHRDAVVALLRQHGGVE